MELMDKLGTETNDIAIVALPGLPSDERQRYTWLCLLRLPCKDLIERCCGGFTAARVCRCDY